jgi:hypothetical protein
MEKLKTLNTLKGSVCKFEDLLGRSLYKAEADDAVLTLYLSNTNYVQFSHHQDCCEHVYIEDICGDLNDLVGSPLLEAEEVSDYLENTKNPTHGHFTSLLHARDL